MAAFYTGNSYKREGLPLSTGKAFRGRQFEIAAAAFYRRRGHRILARNLRVSGVETDLIVEKNNQLILVEVRGRVSTSRLPSHHLSPAKCYRLYHAAQELSRREKRAVHIELLQVTGDAETIPRGWGWLGLRLCPERWFRFEVFQID